MKKLHVLFLLLAIISACDSPTEVQADRKIIDLRKDGRTVFKIIPEVIDLEYLLYSKKIETKLKIENLTSNNLILKDVIFKGNSKFYSLLQNFSLFMQSFASDSISITVNPNKFGEFTDTLYFREYFKPYVVINCIVPKVFCSDIDFSSTQINTTKLQTIEIYNFSENPIEITDYRFVGDSSSFKIESFNPKISPLIVPAGGLPRQIIVSFRPEAKKLHSAIVIFDIRSQNIGKIDNFSKLVGVGI